MVNHEAISQLGNAALESEKACIGTILIADYPIDTYRAASEHVTFKDFYSASHKTLWKVIGNLSAGGRGADMVTVVGHLKETGELEAVGGEGYLIQCANESGSQHHIATYAKSVRLLSLRRELLAVNGKISRLAQDPALTPEAAVAEASAMLRELSKSVSPGWVTASAVVQDMFKRAHKIEVPEGSNLSPEQFTVPVSTTGLGFLDDYLHGGYMTQSLNLVAARSSVGKSAFVISSAVSLLRQGKRIAICSFEMAKEAYTARMQSQLSGVQAWKVRQGCLTKEEHARHIAAAADIELWDDQCQVYAGAPPDSQRLLWMVQNAADNGAEYVFIDHVGIVAQDGRSRYEAQSATADAMLAAKQICGVPIIALVQFNRANEKDLRQPTMADIRDSGKWEENADLIIGLHRPAQASREQNIKRWLKDNRNEPEPMIVGILKNREGETGSMDSECEFYGPLAQLRDGRGNEYIRRELGLNA